VLDDGSTDGTLAAAQDAAADDPRVLVETQANVGAHETLNRLLDRARGQYLAILNSDDRFAPDRLHRLIAALEAAPGASLATSWLRIVDGDGTTIGAKRAWRDAPPWPPRCPGPRSPRHRGPDPGAASRPTGQHHLQRRHPPAERSRPPTALWGSSLRPRLGLHPSWRPPTARWPWSKMSWWTTGPRHQHDPRRPGRRDRRGPHALRDRVGPGSPRDGAAGDR
jgi:hypothetical protein